MAANSCQTISGFTIGCSYTLSFDCSRRTSSSLKKEMSVTIDNGALKVNVSRPSNSSFLLLRESFNFTATRTTHTISFKGVYISGSRTIGLVIDNVSLNPTPTFKIPVIICENDSAEVCLFRKHTSLYNWVDPVGNNIKYWDSTSTTSLTDTCITVKSSGDYILNSKVCGVNIRDTASVTVIKIPRTFFFDTICDGDSILINGKFHSNSGTYYDTLTAYKMGCDSIIKTNLTVNPKIITEVDSTICFEDSILINGKFHSNSGTYYDTLTAYKLGCDSIIKTNLTVNPKIITVVDSTICFEDSILINGKFHSNSGTYYDTLTAYKLGCDSIIKTNLTANPKIITEVDSTICFEDSILINGKFHSNSGTYYDTLTAYKLGCDSIIKTNLTVNPKIITVVDSTICFEDSILINGKFHSNSGTYYDTLTAYKLGCDSIIKTNLTVNPKIITEVDSTICFEDSILINGKFHSNSGTYYDTLTAYKLGCDSIIKTNLTVNPKIITFSDKTICHYDSIFIGGYYTNTSGLYFDTLSSSSSCDSIVVTRLMVTPNIKLNIGNDTLICKNESINITLDNTNASYLWSNGTTTNTTTFLEGKHSVIVNQNGCIYSDTILISTVSNPEIDLGEDLKHCFWESTLDLKVNGNFSTYSWSNGSNINTTTIDKEGFYSVVVTNSYGCSARDEVYVKNHCLPVIFVPSAFTPNNDGVNDVFFVIGINIEVKNYLIFNR